MSHSAISRSAISRRLLLTGGAAALGLAGAETLTACTRYHPVAASAGSAATAGGSGSPSSGSSASHEALPPVPAHYAIAPSRPQPVPGKTEMGAFLQLKNMSVNQAVALRRQQLGRSYAVQQWFYQFNDTFAQEYSTSQGAATLAYSWFGTTYNDILAGKWDQHFITNAQRLAGYGKPIFMRFAWEMNGHWYKHSGARNGNNPAKFIKTWRYVYEIFQKHGATNVGWVWSPYYRSDPAASWNAIENYYPGDAYVDWVGVSGYFTVPQQTPESIFDPVYMMYAGKKPIMIAEIGIVKMDPRVMAGRLESFADYVERRPGIASVVWFDTNVHVNYLGQHVDLRVDINPNLLAAYRTMGLSPHFST